MTLPPGTQVDRYQVEALLGSGGMGEVYRARDPRLDRLVALKIVRGDRNDAASTHDARLLREARAAAALSHPNVVVVYEVGEVKEPESLRGTTYIAMELVVGKSLREHMKDPEIPIARRLGWMKDAARALAAAHEAGIVHRDIKPENVMIRADGVVKVVDFGIARRTIVAGPALSGQQGGSLFGAATSDARSETLTSPGAIAGTPYYMAPEQLRGEEIDGRADQFAWAVTTYEALTGQRPWRRVSDALSVGIEILSVEPPPASEAAAGISTVVSETLQRAMSKIAADRFPSMTELLLSLERAEVRSEAERTRMPRRRWPLVAALGLALAIVGGVAMRPSKTRSTTAAAPASALASSNCTSSAACSRAHGGAAWRCSEREHRCLAIESEDCSVHAEPGDLERDDTVWLAGMYPLKNREFAPEVNAIELARQEFAEVLGSAAPLADGSKPRAIATVICHEGDGPDDALRVARHLEAIHVPAVIGFWRAAPASKAIAKVLIPAGMLSFVAINQSSALLDIPEPIDAPRLVWRSTVHAAAQARPLAALVEQVIEPKLRASGLVEPMRVAVVRKSGSSNDEYVATLFRALRYNGKPALGNGANYRELVIDERADAGEGNVVDELIAFAPHVVFPASEAFDARVLPVLERKWRSGPRPYYLYDTAMSSDVARFVGKDASRRQRFFGVTNFSTTMTNAELVLRYNAVHPDAPVTRTDAPQPSYDAFYTLAYATHALGEQPIDGAALSRALARLTAKDETALHVEVGPTPIMRAYKALRAGRNVDLQGALGSLDFDPQTGEAPIDYAILCLGLDDRGFATTGVEAGLLYDETTSKLTGELRCP